jgi:hypothetical protein
VTVRAAFLGLLLLAPAALARADDWQPDPARRRELRVTDEAPAPATPAEDRWVASLVAGLARGGATPKVVRRFSRVSATYAINRERQTEDVYLSREAPRIYLVVGRSVPAGAEFVADFQAKELGAFALGGSVFLPPSRSFCVVVLDADRPIRGIPIAVTADNPSFSDHSVSWY